MIKLLVRKIKHDVNGNPRYIVNILQLVNGVIVNDTYRVYCNKVANGKKSTYKYNEKEQGLLVQSYNVASDMSKYLGVDITQSDII